MRAICETGGRRGVAADEGETQRRMRRQAGEEAVSAANDSTLVVVCQDGLLEGIFKSACVLSLSLDLLLLGFFTFLTILEFLLFGTSWVDLVLPLAHLVDG